MREHILTLNAGSSSIKFALFARDEDFRAPRLSGGVDGLGLQTHISIRGGDGGLRHEGALEGSGGSSTRHGDALAAVLRWLERNEPQARVVAVGHRVVHGGVRFDAPALVDDEVLAALAALAPLAPLHQSHNIAGIRAAASSFAGVPQVACFDTAFHRAQPALNRRFALPRQLHDQGLQRYGFHGLSYESIGAQLRAAHPRAAQGRTVVAHLGNGASMCALHAGRSVATTMSFSPLDGLPMGTRCGRIDAALVLHLLQQRGMSAEQVATLLYRGSGLLGISGVSSDMRELEASSDAAAREAIDYFVEHALREFAAMGAALRGIDALVFTGGIGENSARVRERIVVGARWLGLELDAAANLAGATRISAPGSAVDVLVLHTNEEAVIAYHTARLFGATQHA
jgi:acetate kinase